MTHPTPEEVDPFDLQDLFAASRTSTRLAARIANIDEKNLRSWMTGRHRPHHLNWADAVEKWQVAGVLEPKPDDGLVSQREMCTRLRIKAQLLLKWHQLGLPHVGTNTRGSKYRYDPELVEAWVLQSAATRDTP